MRIGGIQCAMKSGKSGVVRDGLYFLCRQLFT